MKKANANNDNDVIDDNVNNNNNSNSQVVLDEDISSTIKVSTRSSTRNKIDLKKDK
jgi:hypothetical protein